MVCAAGCKPWCNTHTLRSVEPSHRKNLFLLANNNGPFFGLWGNDMRVNVGDHEGVKSEGWTHLAFRCRDVLWRPTKLLVYADVHHLCCHRFDNDKQEFCVFVNGTLVKTEGGHKSMTGNSMLRLGVRRVQTGGGRLLATTMSMVSVELTVHRGCLRRHVAAG